MTDTFKIPGEFSNSTPFNKMHFWTWAQGMPREKVEMGAYLASLGFVTGSDRLSAQDYETLRHAVDAFHSFEPWAKPRKLADCFTAKPEAGRSYWVRGLESKQTPAADIMGALIESGWIYEANPENTYFEIVTTADGTRYLFAKYQRIIGSRRLCEILEG